MSNTAVFAPVVPAAVSAGSFITISLFVEEPTSLFKATPLNRDHWLGQGTTAREAVEAAIEETGAALLTAVYHDEDGTIRAALTQRLYTSYEDREPNAHYMVTIDPQGQATTTEG